MAAPRKGVLKELVMAVARRDICGGFVSKDSHSTRTVLAWDACNSESFLRSQCVSGCLRKAIPRRQS